MQKKRVKQALGEQILEAFVCQCALLAVVLAALRSVGLL
jgi:hypothetical protein